MSSNKLNINYFKIILSPELILYVRIKLACPEKFVVSEPSRKDEL